MEKKAGYLIAGVVLAAFVIASVYVIPRMSEHFTAEYDEVQSILEKERAKHLEGTELRFVEGPGDFRGMFVGINLLDEETREKAEQIAHSDEVVNAVLQVVGDTELQAHRGLLGQIAILNYSSERKWSVQVTVNIKTEEVESVVVNRNVIPLIFNPTGIVQIAEKEFPPGEIGAPLLKKVTPSGEDVEVVFLTKKGTYTVTVNPEEGKTIHLEKETMRPFFLWMWPIWTALVVIVAVVFVWILRRKSSGTTEEIQEETIQETDVEEGST